MNCQRQDACAHISPNMYISMVMFSTCGVPKPQFTLLSFICWWGSMHSGNKIILTGHTSHKHIPSIPKLLTPNYIYNIYNMSLFFYLCNSRTPSSNLHLCPFFSFFPVTPASWNRLPRRCSQYCHKSPSRRRDETTRIPRSRTWTSKKMTQKVNKQLN